MKTYRSARMDKLLKEDQAYARLVIEKAIKNKELAKKKLRIAIKNSEVKSAAVR